MGSKISDSISPSVICSSLLSTDKMHAMAEPLETTAAPAWVRWAMPSVEDLFFIALLGVLLCTPLSVKLLGDAGTGWHIRTGQQILATHSIPRVDPFSSTMPGKPWFAWEWLYDITAGELESLAGLNGVVWMTAIVIAATFAWLFRSLIARGANLLSAIVMTLLAICASMIHFLARPHVFSWLFTLAFFWILESGEKSSEHDRSTRRLWLLPLLTLLWVNLHAGFLQGFALIAIYWLASMWTWLTLRDNRLEDVAAKLPAEKRTVALTLVGIACAVASLVNPYGWRLHQHIVAYLSNKFLMSHIEEFQSPNFHTVAPQCFLWLLLIAVAAMIWKSRQMRLSHVLVALLAIYSGLYASRNLPTSSILLVMIAAPLLPAVRSSFFQRMTAIESRQRGYLWPIAAVMLTGCAVANHGRIGSTQWIDAHFDPQRMPVGAVDYIEQTHLTGPVFCPDYWGGYAIYRLSPGLKVVIDDRHDFYGEQFLQSYLHTIHAEQDWRQFLRMTAPAVLVLPRNAALTSILIATGNWQPIYTDNVSAVFLASSKL